jgi:two-component system, cell cycle response regulator
VACARALERTCRPQDLLARAGDTELVAILPRLHFAGAALLAQRVHAELAGVALVERGTRVACHPSVGVASYPGRDIESANDLVRFAHAALSRARAEGRGHVCLYQHHGYLIQPT